MTRHVRRVIILINTAHKTLLPIDVIVMKDTMMIFLMSNVPIAWINVKDVRMPQHVNHAEARTKELWLKVNAYAQQDNTKSLIKLSAVIV